MTDTSVPEPQPIETAERIGAAVQSKLSGLADMPVAEHADIYQLVHADLQAALAEVDGR